MLDKLSFYNTEIILNSRISYDSIKLLPCIVNSIESHNGNHLIRHYRLHTNIALNTLFEYHQCKFLLNHMAPISNTLKKKFICNITSIFLAALVIYGTSSCLQYTPIVPFLMDLFKNFANSII